MSKPTRVVGAIFYDGQRFFACRKKPGKPLEGHWEFPGGKIETGEIPEQALAREIREGLNLIAEVGQKVTTTTYEYEFASIELTTFYCTLEDFLKEMGITQHKLAIAIGVPPRRINEIVHGKRAITAGIQFSDWGIISGGVRSSGLDSKRNST